MFEMKKGKITSIYLGMCIVLFLLAGCGAAGKEDTDANAEETMAEATEIETEIATGLIFDLPDGFKAEADTPGFYKSGEYEEDYACIFYQEAAADDRYELLTEDTISELMQEAYAELYGIETEVEVKDFHRFNLDGYEAYRMETEYTVKDVPLQVIEYTVITTDKNFSVTYMQKKNAGWKAAFMQSAESLQVRK